MSKSIEMVLFPKSGAKFFPASPRPHRFDEFAVRLFLGGLLSSMARLRFTGRYPSSDRRKLSVNRFLQENIKTGLEGTDKAKYQRQGWAKSEYRSGADRSIELTVGTRFAFDDLWGFNQVQVLEEIRFLAL